MKRKYYLILTMCNMAMVAVSKVIPTIIAMATESSESG